ncbi:PHD/YefM family antitoxin component YafN of YafNO toxin-antitoxin module [Rhizobium leguminosarum]|uniref:Antitoxin n=1 Tax=Rhizobium leguminosarum TaxID=384 RepID=A0AAE2MGI6_RHILE|nr:MULTISPECIES: type II toxin-antitoxin system prevent-host-death family antitoxin [Rhizobium]MBB4288951.1 PHD/YefM family antitoxin component YafN of YafNO toxin-antitoxin module [Rhizobium leguminosarum]MBB4294956.1 PHD/YefM family antitoxin component YafN of YafNO toxin-antitoxin module [Rhizobium leguminosarum]MBB4306349.1 PHD/YefM family antitoxin component YafN of YafNO toxin-antitoxin module [Rhizobium leguminosarum]MBB4418070.1 PHD/YefM family antitoxin component YafN of YafNO toxin-an
MRIKSVALERDAGPQLITLRGEPAAVVLSSRDYDALRAGRPTLVDDLLGGPARDEELADAVETRANTPSRGASF